MQLPLGCIQADKTAPTTSFGAYTRPDAAPGAAAGAATPLPLAPFGLYYSGDVGGGASQERFVAVDYTVVEDVTPLVGVVQCWSRCVGEGEGEGAGGAVGGAGAVVVQVSCCASVWGVQARLCGSRWLSARESSLNSMFPRTRALWVTTCLHVFLPC
jgi:hypothetical protein